MGPHDPENWWYVRCASLLRKIYIKEPIGVSRLKTIYGGRQSRGSKPEHFKKGSGSIIRKALQQLENAGLVAKEEKKGRKLTARGRSFLDRVAHKLKLKIQKEIPELRKY